MKTYKVYELINLYGTVEYVGVTSVGLDNRFQRHTRTRPSSTNSGYGKFYGRQDLTIIEVAEFNTKKEAELYEGKLKLAYRMEWTERTRGSKKRIFITDKHKIEMAEHIKNGWSTRRLSREYGYHRTKIDEFRNEI